MKAYRVGTTVIVRKELTAIGQRTTPGTVARIVKPSGLMAGSPDWYTIETQTAPARFWSVKAEDIQKAAHPWGWYQMPHDFAEDKDRIR